MINARECQPCTACCDGWLQTYVNGNHLYPGNGCQHSSGGKCGDYDNRPHDPCGAFTCGWLMNESPLPTWMQPCYSKVIVVFNRLRWRDGPVDLAVPVGRRIPSRALKWLLRYAEKSGRPLLYTEQPKESDGYSRQQTVYAYGPAEFCTRVAAMKASGQQLW